MQQLSSKSAAVKLRPRVNINFDRVRLDWSRIPAVPVLNRLSSRMKLG